MQLFSDWITQLVLFILLGTILELLLPENQMKKYVNLILGLLLLLILSKPVLHVFSVDVSTIMKPVEQIIQEDGSIYTEIENQIKKQKDEIQAGQDAYIWNEIALQLQEEGNQHLPDKFSREITELSLEHDEANELTAIVVTLEEEREADQEDNLEIESVEIETDSSKHQTEPQADEDKAIATFLADVWETDSSIIYFKEKGGAR